MMSRLSRNLFCLAAIVMGGVACVSQETDPTRVTWGDLAEGKRLNSYLESRKADLAKLDAEARGLSSTLQQRQATLDAVEAALVTAERDASASATELTAIRNELARSNQQLAAAKTQAAELQAQVSSLRANLLQLQDKRAAQEQIALNEVKLQRLQGEVEVLERSIERTLLVRARHALQMADL
jgi:chromosome segregation ATPase